MKRILLICFMMVSVLVNPAWAQERTVSGKVTSAEDGSGLPGVNVIIKGTSTGATTDIDGNFKLSVPDGAVLQFSAVGFAAQEVAIGSRSVIDLQMELDVKQLSEVVVTAFGVQKEQKSIGYAVQTVQGDQFTKSRETNMVNSLTGRIAGVQVTNSSGGVGSSSRIVLRGPSSITGNNQPLFVVDGIPINNASNGNSGSGGGNDTGNGAADINPDDVESITVLKGPNAAALYGSRGANGVILVTTKSGKGTKGIGVSVNSTLQYEKPMKLPTFQNSYGQGGNPNFFEWINGSNDDGGVDESWGMPLDVGLEATQWINGGASPTPWVSQPDNVKDFFETGVTRTNNIALSGGNEKGSMRLSLTNLDAVGTIPNTDKTRNTVALNSNYKLTDKLTADFSVNYVKNHSDNLPEHGYTGNNPIQQFIWSGRNVDFNALKDYENLPAATSGLGVGISPVNWNNRFQNNPFWQADKVTARHDKDRVFGNVKIAYQLTDNLSIFARSGMDFFSDEVVNSYPKGDVNTTNGNGFYRRTQRTFTERNNDFLMSYNNNFGDDISLGVNVGGNQMYQESKVLSGTAPELELPNVYNLSNGKSGVNVQTANNYSQKRINSFYGSANIGFRNYVFLDLTARNDWSSTLPKGNNSYFYPSATVSAVISDIIGVQSGVLSFLKVRGGWAKVGSDTGPYNLVQTFGFRSPWGAVISPSEGNSLLNPELRPEITTSVEAGLDARLLSGRINLDVTVYKKNTVDQIIPISITGASGYTSRFSNIGEMENKGIEVQLNGDILRSSQNDGLVWNMAVNFARNINEVVSLAPGVDQLTIGGQWSTNIIAAPGEPYGAIFGPGFLKDPDGNIVHSNGSPVTDGTFRILGNTTPDFTGGLNNSFSFKGLNFNFLVDGRRGGDIYSMTTTWGRYAGVLEETLLGREGGIVGKGVIANGDGTYRPNDVVVRAETYNKAAYANSIAESSVFDGTYLKLRQVQLGYTLPNKMMGRLPFRDVTLSVVGRNLMLLYSTVPHIDPESSFNNGNAQGLEFGQIPSNRSVGFNLSFKL